MDLAIALLGTLLILAGLAAAAGTGEDSRVAIPVRAKARR